MEGVWKNFENESGNPIFFNKQHKDTHFSKNRQNTFFNFKKSGFPPHHGRNPTQMGLPLPSASISLPT